jgi:hypothetical protein
MAGAEISKPNPHALWIEHANACRADIARLEAALAATTGNAGSGSPPDAPAEPRS